MYRKVILILFVLFGSLKIIYSQDDITVWTCDTTYSEYKVNKKKLGAIISIVNKKSFFSKSIREELGKYVREEKYARLESVIYDILHNEWCDATKKFAIELLSLNIPSLNSWIVTEAFSNYVQIDCSDTIQICTNDYGIVSYGKLRELSKNEIDEVSLAHNAKLLNPFMDKKLLEQLSYFRYSENVFVKFTYAQLLYYNKQNKKCREILIEILNEEINGCNGKEPYSQNYIYAPLSLKLFDKISRSESHFYYKKLVNLYENAFKYYENISVKTIEQINNFSDFDSLKNEMNMLYEVKNCP